MGFRNRGMANDFISDNEVSIPDVGMSGAGFPIVLACMIINLLIRNPYRTSILARDSKLFCEYSVDKQLMYVLVVCNLRYCR